MRQAPWSRIRGQNSVNKEVYEIVGNGKPTGSVLKETIAVSGTISISVRNRHSPNPSPRSSTRQNVKNASRTRSPGGSSPSGRMSRLPCKNYLKGTCTTPFCKKWHPPECLFYKSEMDADVEKSAPMRTASSMNSPAQGLKRMLTKVQWLC